MASLHKCGYARDQTTAPAAVAKLLRTRAKKTVPVKRHADMSRHAATSVARKPPKTVGEGLSKRGKVVAIDAVPATAISEPEAIRGAQNGDSACFEVLYTHYKRRVYSLCLRMVGDAAEAEELAQEAFLQVYRKIHTFRGESAFSTWLHRLVVNVVLMHLRKKVLPQFPLEEILQPRAEDEPKREFGQHDSILRVANERVVLERAIAYLPPGYRLIFILHDVEGYEHKEIADMLGCTVGNSKSQLHKARLRLRVLLKDGNIEEAVA
jgi:RNA polymerase sigma-70 factor (ECF subfamily)